MPPPPTDAANATSNDTSTFIASTTIGEAPQNNQQMARRVAKTGGTEEDSAKEIRRDSKGFENFDDYFESDANDSTMTTGEKTNDESLQEDSESTPKEQPNAFTTSVPAPTETMPEEILDGDKTAASKNKKSNLQDLSKEWEDEEVTEEQPVKEATEKVPEQVNEQVPEQISEASAPNNDIEMQEVPEAETEKESTGNFFSEFKVSLATLNFPPKMKNFKGQILTKIEFFGY